MPDQTEVNMLTDDRDSFFVCAFCGGTFNLRLWARYWWRGFPCDAECWLLQQSAPEKLKD